MIGTNKDGATFFPEQLCNFLPESPEIFDAVTQKNLHYENRKTEGKGHCELSNPILDGKAQAFDHSVLLALQNENLVDSISKGTNLVCGIVVDRNVKLVFKGQNNVH